jgi:hypothetical protein
MPTIKLPQELAKVTSALQGEGAAPRALRAAIRRGQRFHPRLPLALQRLAAAMATTLTPSQLVRVILNGFLTWRLAWRVSLSLPKIKS